MNAAQLVFFGDVSRVIHIPAVVAVSTSRASWLLLLNCDVVEDGIFLIVLFSTSNISLTSLGILQSGQWFISVVSPSPCIL